MLRDGGTSSVSARVFEKVLFVVEGLNVDGPLTFLLLAEELFELPPAIPRDKLICLCGCAKNRNYGSLPGSH